MREEQEQRLRAIMGRVEGSFAALVRHLDHELRESGLEAAELGPGLKVLARVTVGDASYGLTRTDVRALRQLTEREREVARLAADGLANKNIALALDIRPSTVAAHLRRVYDKLGVDCRAELTRRVVHWS